ncbi:hypothetical protein E4T42_05967 [Aureobasidium subglaciale]|nr:hypothetical protein E4T42_05967 [Aureobasidium subglaciale]
MVVSSTSRSAAVPEQASHDSASEVRPAPVDIEKDQDFSSDSDDASNSSQALDFNATHCLFCSNISDDIDTNLIHMSKSHGMTIPSPHQLSVDPTTLLNYLNLVISLDHECLTCGTQRRNTQAIRQHMLGKGHCAFDISDVESEYREFWEFEVDDEKAEVDGDNITLPSGRVVTSRSSRATQQRRRLQASDMGASPDTLTSGEGTTEASSSSTIISQSSGNQTLTKQDLRALNHGKQLGALRASDRLALAHLPASEQRAILDSQHKQLQKARRQERDMQARLQRKNNQTLMKHFVPDVPGPKLG